MSRRVVRRHRLTGWLEALGGLHVGGLGAESDVDLALARDGLGRLYVPGTSLAGALRAATAPVGDDEAVAAMWGPLPGPGQNGFASRLTVDDGVVAADGTAAAEWEQDSDPGAAPRPPVIAVRDHVGIDRVTGTAADDVFYRRALLPPGTHVRLGLTFDEPPDGGAVVERYHALLARLADGFTLGAGTTAGLGRVRLAPQRTSVAVSDLQTRAGLASLLDAPASVFQRPNVSPASTNVFAMVLEWRADTPVSVRSGAEGVAIDAYPLAEWAGGELRLVIPGTSIKGALRAVAERVCGAVTDSGASPATLLGQLAAAPAPVQALFGGAGDRENGSSWIGKAALSVEDLVATVPVAAEVWNEVVDGPKEAVDPRTNRQALSKSAAASLRAAGLQQRDHVAIDRWTGGAAPGLLFSALDPVGVEWPPLRLEVDKDRLAASGMEDAALGLLWLVIREMRGGRVSIGFGANRGRGSVTVTGGSVSESGVREPMPLSGVDGRILARWDEGWRAWWRSAAS